MSNVSINYCNNNPVFFFAIIGSLQQFLILLSNRFDVTMDMEVDVRLT